MSSNSRYMTFNPMDRFSQPTEEVAQRLTSVWLLESCCGSCCCPWKRRTSQKPNDKLSSSIQDTRKNEEKKFDSQVLDDDDNDDLAQNNELNSNSLPLNLINKKNQEKNFASDSSDDEDKNNYDHDDQKNNEDQFSNEIMEKKKSDYSLEQKTESKTFDFLSKRNKPFLRKFSLDITKEKEKNVPIFRKYSLSDYVEPDGSPVFKRCVSFKKKKESSDNNEEIKNGDEEMKNKNEVMKNKQEEVNIKGEGIKNIDDESEEENSSEDEEKKGLFDSDTDDSEDYEDVLIFNDNITSDDLKYQRDDKNLKIEKRNSRRMRLLTKNGILPVLPNVQEIDEEINNSSGIFILHFRHSVNYSKLFEKTIQEIIYKFNKCK